MATTTMVTSTLISPRTNMKPRKSYCKTCRGVLRIFEIIFSVFTFICCIAGPCHNTSQAGWSGFVSFIALVAVTVLVILYFLDRTDIIEPCPLLFIELLFYTTWTMFYLIAASVLTTLVYHVNIMMSGEVHSCRYNAAAGAFFAFSLTLMFLVDTILIFKDWYRGRSDDDFVDKLNYYYTSALIFSFAIIASSKEFVGYPIQCWIPPQFTASWEQYTEDFCYVEKRTYYLPIHKEISGNIVQRRMKSQSYYKLVPFILAFEALLFHIPSILWRGFLQWPSGIDVQSLAQMARDVRQMPANTRPIIIRTIAGHMEDALETHADITSRYGFSSMFGKHIGAYVTYIYLLIKMLYVLNGFGQIALLNMFLGTKDLFYGLHLFLDMLTGREWHESGNFPRTTLCDFDVRVLGNLQHHTVQCVLPINMFNEKIFLFLWFWISMITVITVCSLLHWLVISFFPSQPVRFVRKYLQATHLVSDRQSEKMFVKKFLGFDGIFCLRMISAHAGEIIATELIVTLWHNFNDRSQKSPVRMFDTQSMSLQSSASRFVLQNLRNVQHEV